MAYIPVDVPQRLHILPLRVDVVAVAVKVISRILDGYYRIFYGVVIVYQVQSPIIGPGRIDVEGAVVLAYVPRLAGLELPAIFYKNSLKAYQM